MIFKLRSVKWCFGHWNSHESFVNVVLGIKLYNRQCFYAASLDKQRSFNNAEFILRHFNEYFSCQICLNSYRQIQSAVSFTHCTIGNSVLTRLRFFRFPIFRSPTHFLYFDVYSGKWKILNCFGEKNISEKVKKFKWISVWNNGCHNQRSLKCDLKIILWKK